MENKTFAEMTIAEKFRFIAENLEGTNLEGTEVQAFLLDRANKASRKNSGEHKPSKTQVEMTDVIMPLVLDALEEVGKPITVGELIKVPTLAEFVTASGDALTSSKVTSALTKLKDAKKVVRDDVKGKGFYAVA